MDIVLICRDRALLTEQCIRSMRENAADWSKHRLVVVFDGTAQEAGELFRGSELDNRTDVPTFIATDKQLGVGGAKNYGALWYADRFDYEVGHAPGPDSLLMFSDNDLYWLPEWDAKLGYAMSAHTNTPTQLGGWRHPFHQLGKNVGGFVTSEGPYEVREVDAVTGNCFVIRWSDWLRYGPFDSNAIGPGQSEDYALSQRIKAGGGLVATLDPPVAIHCGLVNSIGEPATGWRECEQQITEQLAGLSAGMRNDILIARPVPDPAKMRQMGMENAKAAQADGIWDFGEPPTPRRWGIDHRVFESARARLWMRPRDPIVPTRMSDGIAPRRERAGLGMENVPERKLGINLGSGQRKFESTPEITWINIDLVSRPPDQVPDLVADARELDRHFDPRSIDYVVSHHLHEHLGHGEADPITLAAYRVLKPGGSLFVFTPDARKLAGRWLGGELDDFQFAVQMMGAYQGLESDRHKWVFTQETLAESLANAAPWTIVKPFDWREVSGMSAARDWYIAAVECVK